MKMNGKMTRALAMILALTAAFALLIPAGAVEPRLTTNGYTETNVTYSGKSYTVAATIGIISSTQEAYCMAYCPIADIKIDMSGVTAKFDTISHGYDTKTGEAGAATSNGVPTTNNVTSESNPYIYSRRVASNYSVSQVIRVVEASGSATLNRVNNGSNVTLNPKFTYSN